MPGSEPGFGEGQELPPGEHAAGHGSIAAGPRERQIVTVALLLAMAVAALEQTVVSTAMPTIIARLRGLDIYPWVFSAYLLASTITTPLYGKLADLVGRKRVLLFGLALFSAGSMLSGCAQSMPQLIAMRVVQGVGAGALGPIVLTMIGDLYSLKQRAKVQGLFSGVWGGASLVGPALGGFLTDHLSWRWVFFVTVPFGVVAAWILLRHVHERLERRSGAGRGAFPAIDWLGATLLAGGSSALLLAVLGGSGQPWSGGLPLLGLAAVLTVLLVLQERRASDPVLPLDLLIQPAIAAAILGSFVLGAILFGIDTYIPLFVQGVLGGTASQAGSTITPLFLFWSISVALAAKVVIRLGFRTTALTGSILIATGSLALVLGARSPAWSRPAFLLGMLLLGLGMGPTSLCLLLDVQGAVAWSRRGVATGAVLFFRMIGAALGVGVLGASLGRALARRLAEAGAVGIDVAAALRPETHARLAPAQLGVVQAALGQALQGVFLQVFLLSLVGIACASRLTRKQASPAPDGGRSDPVREESLSLAAAAEL